MNLSKLKEPFKAEDIEWRIQQSGETNGRIWAKVLAYVTARAIENRLDEVCGPENWKNEFRKEGENGEYLCGISIKIDGEWITKWDGCSALGTNSNIDGFKTALSGSIKRAAATGWGIGRYLYSLDEGWAVICEDGMYSAKLKDSDKWFKWNPPALPAWALPKGEAENFQTTEGNSFTKDDESSKTDSKPKGRKSKAAAKSEEEIKAQGNTIISRIGLVMKREENGSIDFTEPEINQIRGLVANTQLNENGIKELEELEKFVRMELESRLSKMAA